MAIAIRKGYSGVDPRDYSRDVGTGSAAVDKAALQWAINMAFAQQRAVVLPPDTTFLVTPTHTGACVFTRPGVAIVGLGGRSSVVRIAPGTTDTTTWFRVFSSDYANNQTSAGVVFENFAIDGNLANLGTLTNSEQHHGILLHGNSTYSRCHISNMFISNCMGDGIIATGKGSDISVSNSTLSGNRRVGVNLGTTNRARVSGCDISGSAEGWIAGEYGVKIEVDDASGTVDVSQVTVSHNSIRCVGGIALSGNAVGTIVRGATVTGNTIRARSDGRMSTGVAVGAIENAVISSNSISGFELGVLIVGNAAGIAISDNLIADGPATATDVYRAAIQVGGTTNDEPISDVVISSNIVRGVYRGLDILQSINLERPSGVTVSGNRITADELAVKLAAADRIRFDGNHFETTAGSHAVDSISPFAGTPAADVAFVNNQFSGGSTANLALTGASTTIRLVGNRWLGAPAPLSGPPITGPLFIANDPVLLTGPTASRPALHATSGVVRYFDTTLNAPVWWNGTAWATVGAAGASSVNVTVTGDGATTVFTVTHNLALTTPFLPSSITVLDPGGNILSGANYNLTTPLTNSFTVTFAVAPANGAVHTFRVTA